MKSEIKARQWIMKTQLEKSTRLRHSMLVGVLVSVAILAGSASAQTFTVSNLGETPAPMFPSDPVGPSNWRAVSFTPGASDEYDRYRIESVARRFDTFNVSNEQVFIYSDNSGTVGTLLGSTPASASGSSANPTTTDFQEGGVWVDESTAYWLVFGTSPGATFAYSLGRTAADTETTTGDSDPWTIGDTSLQSTDLGVTWAAGGSTVPAFTLTAIPEPSEYVLASAFVIGIFILTRRRRSFG